MSSGTVLSCEFCGSTFATKSGLNLHLKSAKYCLQLQGKENSNAKCSYCQKDFGNRINMDGHMSVCVPRIKQENEAKLLAMATQYEAKLAEQVYKSTELAQMYEAKLAEQVHKSTEFSVNQAQQYEQRLAEQKREYEAKLKEQSLQIESIHKSHHEALIKLAAQRSSVVNNNHNINISAPLDLSVENVKKVIDQHLTLQVIGDGQVGVANMLHENLLTNDKGELLYQCTDANRGHFLHLDGTGQPVRDVKASRLKAALVEAKVGQKAIETLQANMPADDARFPHYEVKAMEVLAIHSNQDAKFRGALAAACAPRSVGVGSGDKESKENDEDEDEDSMLT